MSKVRRGGGRGGSYRTSTGKKLRRRRRPLLMLLLLLPWVDQRLIQTSQVMMDQIHHTWTRSQRRTTGGRPAKHKKGLKGEIK